MSTVNPNWSGEAVRALGAEALGTFDSVYRKVGHLWPIFGRARGPLSFGRSFHTASLLRWSSASLFGMLRPSR